MSATVSRESERSAVEGTGYQAAVVHHSRSPLVIEEVARTPLQAARSA